MSKLTHSTDAGMRAVDERRVKEDGMENVVTLPVILCESDGWLTQEATRLQKWKLRNG